MIHDDKTTKEEPNYNCPTCDRPTLAPATGEIARWRCGVCGTLVTEAGEPA